MSEKNKIDGILQQLKKDQTPTGLHGGLTLKMSAQAGGLWQLIAWRDGVAPSLQEIGVLVEAIKRVDRPQLVVHSPVQDTGKGRFYYRIWWWECELTVSWLRPSQGALFDGQKQHNYLES